jgi:hypothetical protein
MATKLSSLSFTIFAKIRTLAAPFPSNSTLSKTSSSSSSSSSSSELLLTVVVGFESALLSLPSAHNADDDRDWNATMEEEDDIDETDDDEHDEINVGRATIDGEKASIERLDATIQSHITSVENCIISFLYIRLLVGCTIGIYILEYVVSIE